MGQELRDSSGKVIGYFYTPEEELKRMYEIAWLEHDLQAERDRANGVVKNYDLSKAMTTAEVLAHLDRLGREAKEGK